MNYFLTIFIGGGCGEKVWNFLISYCKKRSINSFSLVAIPEVAVLYTKLGVKVVRTGKSSINNQKVYFLKYSF